MTNPVTNPVALRRLAAATALLNFAVADIGNDTKIHLVVGDNGINGGVYVTDREHADRLAGHYAAILTAAGRAAEILRNGVGWPYEVIGRMHVTLGGCEHHIPVQIYIRRDEVGS